MGMYNSLCRKCQKEVGTNVHAMALLHDTKFLGKNNNDNERGNKNKSNFRVTSNSFAYLC